MSRVVGSKYWVAQTATHSVTLTGAWLSVAYNGHVAADFVTTGTIAGTIKLQHRTQGGDAVDTANAAAAFSAQPAGAAATIQFNATSVPGTEFRFVYTSASGAGTLTANTASGDMPE